MPYVLIHDPGVALLARAVSIMSFLFVLGVFKTRLTRIHWLRSGIETLAIGGISCGLGFLFGRIVNALIG
jgi:VIT1/CCC1 family predicted Fe2+/Mn2+ transporter